MISQNKKTIAMISRAAEAPWDEASKNLVRDIVDSLSIYEFHVLTTKDDEFNRDNIISEKIYTDKKNKFFQKVRLLYYLIKHRDTFDLYHFCFTPEPLTVEFITRFIDKNKKIWSIPYLSTNLIKRYKYINLISEYTRLLIVTSEFTKNILNGYGINNVEVIYPGVDLDKFKPCYDDKLPSINNSFTILYAANLTTEAAIFCIEAIIRKTIKKSSGIKFIIANRIRRKNDIRRKQILQRMLRDNGLNNEVSFIDNVENMPSLLASIDVLIYPQFDGFEKKIDIPYIIVEAFACGKPVIISDKSPLNEVLKDEAGVAIDINEIDKFSEMIIRLKDNPKMAWEIGKENRKVAEKYFDKKKNINKFSDIYNSILSFRN